MRGAGGGVAVIIPARLGASRFPAKLLTRVAGHTVLEWTWSRARRVPGIRDVFIAGDDDAIASAARAFGATYIATGAHASGTDRVAAAAAQIDPAPDWVVNVQGDEPLISPDTIAAVCEAVREETDAIVTCSAPLPTYRDWVDPAVVKVVTGAEGRALYFSRAPIPASKAGGGEAGFAAARDLARVHVGIYGYPFALLVRICALPVSPLERVESLEQLRALEAGVPILVLSVDRHAPSVDTPADLERVRPLLEAERRDASGPAWPSSGRSS